MNLVTKIIEFFRAHDLKRGYTCDGCGDEIFDYPNKKLCDECESLLERNDKFWCDKCGRKSVTAGVCMLCKREVPKFTRGFSPFVYRGKAASLLNAMKRGAPRISAYFGEEIARDFYKKAQDKSLPVDVSGQWLLIAVPLTEKAKRKRGYNQAEELGKVVAFSLNERGMSVTNCFDAVEKTRETTAQKSSSMTERKKNIAGAFRLKKRKIFKDASVLIVDDIMTTGATGSEIAELILNAGAKRTLFLTAAARSEKL